MVVEGIHRALAISIFSRGWAAGLALLAVPLYLRFIGIEAYGVVGFFTSFSILVGFLDLGLGATLTRELTRVSAGAGTLADGRDVVRTFELAYAFIALMIGLLVIFCSVPVAQHWVKAQALDRAEIAQALALAGIALACQWPTNLYSAGLAGVHRQAQLGIATMVFSTFRVALTLTAVWWNPSLESFFWAQIVSMLLQTFGMRWLLWSSLVLAGHRPMPQMSIIRSSFHFAGGMTGIAITSIILTQADKVILSNVLNLADFGIYAVAGTLATGLYMLISPMYSVMYPRFSSLVHAGDTPKLIDLFHTSSQVMAALVMPVAMVIAVYAHEVLFIWTGNAGLSQQGAYILALLIFGNACNGLMNMPYALQLASGWTKLAFWVNVGAIAVLVPVIWWAALSFGAVGGAAVWALLNLSYVILTPQIMHRRLLLGEKIAWYWAGVVLPVLVCSTVLLVLRQIPLEDMSRLSMGMTLLIYWAFAAMATLLLLPRLRERVTPWLRTRLSQLGSRKISG
jgi:O-antigen/teichoic acid export membrane protein